VQCPTATPNITVTAVNASASDPGSSPGQTDAWTVAIQGSFVNTTGAAISGAGVTIFFNIVPGGTGSGTLDDKGVVLPGATATWSSPSTQNLAFAPTTPGIPPSAASVTRAYWSYEDGSLLGCVGFGNW
jgi:hypothetical protein